MANEAVLEKVLADEEFVRELAELDEPEEVRDALNAKGAEVTLEEVRQMAKALASQANGELDEDALEDVAGGCVVVAVTSAVILTGAVTYLLVRIAIRRRW